MPGYVIDTKVIFSFRKLVFLDVRTDYNLDLRFLVKMEISMVMADLSWGHKHFSSGYKRSLLFVVHKSSLLAGYAKNYICLRDHSKLTMVDRL